MSEKIRVILPEKYDLVVGDTFQLFYRGVIETPNPFCYNIVAHCEKGYNFPRYYEFTPETLGTYKLTISVYDAQKNLLGSADTLLCVCETVQKKENINVLCIGDSLTYGGEWPSEVYRRLIAEDGSPKGLNYKNIKFVGTCGNGDVHYEGYGGWKWDSYTLNEIKDIWVVCEHNKTSADQHSVWQDINGNLWKLETIENDRVKFIPFDNKNILMPASGLFTHKENAVNTTDIVIKEAYSKTTSPFYNENTGDISIKDYANKINADSIDLVYILLGCNQIDNFDFLDELCAGIVDEAKNLVDKIHADFPKAKIKVLGYPIPSPNGGCGASYGARLPHSDYYGFARFILHLNIHYELWSKEEKYQEFLEFINVSGQVDSDNSYPTIEKNVNVRCSKKEILDTNGVHPNEEGYMQIADAVFRNLVHQLGE